MKDIIIVDSIEPYRPMSINHASMRHNAGGFARGQMMLLMAGVAIGRSVFHHDHEPAVYIRDEYVKKTDYKDLIRPRITLNDDGDAKNTAKPSPLLLRLMEKL